MKCPKCFFDNPQESTFCGRCAARLDSTEKHRPAFTETMEPAAMEDLTTGTTFAGRYQVIEELGRGGMGRVYKVHDTKIGEKVALKLIRPEAVLDRKSLERFSNELKLARKVRHKNVCQMFDLGEHQGTHYLTMEYIHGEDLRQLIRKVGRLSPAQAVAVARQVCDGLEEAHRLGVVHRDLKPHNIMLDEDGNSRIMDFGIARSLTGKGITGAGVLLGTPEYMSPEQVEGKEVDHRSDIYSLGVILYEMVTGRRPFDGETPLSIAHKHKYEPPEDPRKLDPQVPEDLARVILKCLEKDRAARYESARALEAALAAVESGLPTAEKVVPKKKSAATRDITVTFNLRKLALPVLAGVAVVAATVLLLVVAGRKKPAQAALPDAGKPSIAVMYFDNQTDKDGLDRMLVTLLTTNLSRYGNIEVTSTQRLFDILKLLGKQDAPVIDKSLATEVATRAGVRTMLLGSIIQIGGRLRLVSELFDVRSGSIVGTQTADGTSYDDVFAMVDSITEQVGKKIGGEVRGKLRMTDVTTSSLEALDLYQKGYDLILRWDNQGAEKYLREAVRIDPTFAIAYAYLGIAQLSDISSLWSYYYDLTEVRETLKSARKHMARSTENERWIIQMLERMVHRDYGQAAEFARRLLANKVPEKWAYHVITLDDWMKRDFRNSIRTCERALESDPTDGFSYNMVAYSYAAIEDYQAAHSAIRKYIALEPDVWASHDGAWELCMWQGRYDEALQYADEALKAGPDWTWFDELAGETLIHKREGEAARERFRRLERNSSSPSPGAALLVGCSYLGDGRHREAEAEILQALKASLGARRRSRYRRRLGEVLLIQGKIEEAMEEFSKIDEKSDEEYRFGFNPLLLARSFYRGRVFIKRGEFDKAASAAEEIKRIVRKQNLESLFLDFHSILQAESAMARKRPEEALMFLDRTSFMGWFSSPHYWRVKASAEEALGRFDAAESSYKKFAGHMPLARQGLYDEGRYYYELSMVDYNLGRLDEKRNDPTAAAEHYRKFLDGMKSADPGIPEVDEAKKGLAALTS